VRDGGGWLAIGAMTRHADIERSALLRSRTPLLARVVSTVGDPQVRHRGTIGGSLAHGDPAADAAVALTALRAEVVIDGPGGRRVAAIDDFFRNDGPGTAEIITEVRVPPADGVPWGFAKFRRKSFEWAIVSVAFQGARPGTRGHVRLPGCCATAAICSCTRDTRRCLANAQRSRSAAPQCLSNSLRMRTAV
jgi:carbon-monoxide dehydrogenase medium subunit